MDKGVCDTILVKIPGKLINWIKVRTEGRVLRETKEKALGIKKVRNEARKWEEIQTVRNSEGSKLNAFGRKEGNKNIAQPKEWCYLLHLVKKKTAWTMTKLLMRRFSPQLLFREGQCSRPLNRDFVTIASDWPGVGACSAPIGPRPCPRTGSHLGSLPYCTGIWES